MDLIAFKNTKLNCYNSCGLSCNSTIIYIFQHPFLKLFIATENHMVLYMCFAGILLGIDTQLLWTSLSVAKMPLRLLQMGIEGPFFGEN